MRDARAVIICVVHGRRRTDAHRPRPLHAAYRGEAEGSGITERRNDLTYGVGGQFDFTRNLGVRLEWQRYTDFGGGGFGASGDQDIISVNAIYRFR